MNRSQNQGPKEERTTGMLADWNASARHAYERQNGKVTTMKAGKLVEGWPLKKTEEVAASILPGYLALMAAYERGVKVDSPEALEIVKEKIQGPYKDFAIAAFNAIKSDYVRRYEQAPPPPRPDQSEILEALLVTLHADALE